MKINAMEEVFEAVTVFGIPMLFTCLHIDPATVPEGLYLYEVRNDDDQQGIPVEIAEWILVNHWGDLISSNPLPLIPCEERKNAFLMIRSEDDWNYDGYSMTLKEYMNRDEIADDEDEYWEDEERYTSSCTAGDYGPGNPWDAPGMSIHDFI